jgi:hypothetical protein
MGQLTYGEILKLAKTDIDAAIEETRINIKNRPDKIWVELLSELQERKFVEGILAPEGASCPRDNQ